jgi:hypothetical protein
VEADFTIVREELDRLTVESLVNVVSVLVYMRQSQLGYEREREGEGAL